MHSLRSEHIFDDPNRQKSSVSTLKGLGQILSTHLQVNHLKYSLYCIGIENLTLYSTTTVNKENAPQRSRIHVRGFRR